MHGRLLKAILVREAGSILFWKIMVDAVDFQSTAPATTSYRVLPSCSTGSGKENKVRSKATLLRRSGVALYNVANLLEWAPTAILQVGVGYYSKEVEVFKEAWPEAKLIGFEPHPETIRLMQGYPGLLICKALGRYKGSVRLFWDASHKDGASVHSKAQVDTLKWVDVEIDTLDNRCIEDVRFQSSERILLWLDCEGSELDVLIGGEKFVVNVNVINVELTGKPSRPGWPDPVEVNRWLLDHGFLLQYVHTQRVASGQVDAIYVRPELFRPEYCCCPLMVEEWRKE